MENVRCYASRQVKGERIAIGFFQKQPWGSCEDTGVNTSHPIGCFQKPNRTVTFTPDPFRRFSPMPVRKPVSTNSSVYILSDTASQRICWRMVRTSVAFRSYWDIRSWRRPRSTRMLALGISAGFKVHWKNSI